MAKTLADLCGFRFVEFVPCCQYRGDGKVTKTSDKHRWNMLQLAIRNNTLFRADDYDMKERAGIGKQYTYFTMEYFIMGADLLADIDNPEMPIHRHWKYREELIRENKFVIMSHGGIDMPKVISKSLLLRKYHDVTRFHLVDKGIAMEVGSKYIRDEIGMGRYPRYLMRDEVYDYIMKHRVYSKE